MSQEYPGCSVQSKLKEQQAAAELAYRSAINHMKEVRGMEYERAWRLVEHRRVSLQRARSAIEQHEKEHMCTPLETKKTVVSDVR